jgi:hypothetical protein
LILRQRPRLRRAYERLLSEVARLLGVADHKSETLHQPGLVQPKCLVERASAHVKSHDCFHP